MDRVSKAERELVRKIQKQTNADRIRAMTDEELADWINGVIQHGGVIPYGGTGVTLDWLKAEVEE